MRDVLLQHGHELKIPKPHMTIPVEVVDHQDYLHSLKYIYRRWQGNPVASAEVNQNIHPARAFYEKFGFPETADRVYGVGQLRISGGYLQEVLRYLGLKNSIPVTRFTEARGPGKSTLQFHSQAEMKASPSPCNPATMASSKTAACKKTRRHRAESEQARENQE